MMPIRNFNDSYTGTPPWDIGEPQPDIAAALRKEPTGQTVLDVGCGTGENAFFAASLGNHVVGIDGAPLAIEKAKEKSRLRGIDVDFKVGDALHLEILEKKFDIIIDSGLFHVFDDEERAKYEKSLSAAIKPGGRYYVLCFSETEPPGEGPRRVTQKEIIWAPQTPTWWAWNLLFLTNRKNFLK